MGSRITKYDAILSGINKATVIFLLLALGSWPYSYYIFLRWFVFLSTVLHIGVSISRRRFLVLAVFVPIGMLFNPLYPVYLSKGAWVFIDIFAAMFMVISYEDLNHA